MRQNNGHHKSTMSKISYLVCLKIDESTIMKDHSNYVSQVYVLRILYIFIASYYRQISK